MTDIQQARDVLAKWREGVSGSLDPRLPWTVQNAIPGRKNWDDIIVDADGDWLFSYDEDIPNQDEGLTWNRPGSTDPVAARLIVGIINPELLDMIDLLFHCALGIQRSNAELVDHAQGIAAAIIAAEMRMSA